MAILTQKIRCSSCGNKDEATAARCSNCTRPYVDAPLSSQHLHDEHLWSAPVETRRTRKQNGLGKWFVLTVLVAGIAASNYFYFGYGPDWANSVPDNDMGYDWRAFSGDGYEVFVPGNPTTQNESTAAGTYDVSNVWVDSRWDLLRDAETRSPGAQKEALRSVFATLVTAEGTTTGGVQDSAPAILRTLIPGVTVAETTVTKVVSPSFGTGYDVTASYRGHPTESSSGIVKARLWVVGDTTFAAATYYDDVVDEGLHTKLIGGFTPIPR